MESKMNAPLSGVKILDLTTVVMGPFATQILSELGADVVKVETLDGDNVRHIGPMKNDEMGYLFLSLNRGKRSLAIDLKNARGKEAILKIIPSFDVLIYNIRPQAMNRLGLSYEEVRAVKKNIIYVGCYGYSQRGPYSKKPAYDDLIQAATGLPWIFSKISSEPHYAPVNLADRVTGLHAVSAVTAALFSKERHGFGQSIEVPMFETMAHFVLGDHLAEHSFKPSNGEGGYKRALARRPYLTKDGYISALVYNDGQWKRFLKLIDQEHLLSDPKFATLINRATNIKEVYQFLSEVFETKSTGEWINLLESADIPVAPLNTITDMISDPHLNAGDFFFDENHPTEGLVRAMRTPTDWSGSNLPERVPAPSLGQHTEGILMEAGYTADEIESMRAQNIIKG